MLKPKQIQAIELLVAGATETHTANVVGVDPATIWRWKSREKFAIELKNRTAASMESSCRVVGAQVRATADVALLATNELRGILTDPKAPQWMRLSAAQTAIRNGRWAADKVDKDFNKTETVGRNDPDRQKVADEVTRRIAVWENRDRTLAQLQEYEERRMRARMTQREQELLRRLNIMCRLKAQDVEYMHRYYRRLDDWDEAMEQTRRQKAREEFAQAAGVDVSSLPEPTPIKWADLRAQFKDYLAPLEDPPTAEQEDAEDARAQSLEYPDPQSPAERERLAKFEENFKAVEADYIANVLPKTPPSPIERENRGIENRGMGVPPMSDDLAPDSQTTKDTHGPESHATNKKWSGPIPDADSPERELYLATLADDELPELSESDRRRKEDWDRRRKLTEERERAAG